MKIRIVIFLFLLYILVLSEGCKKQLDQQYQLVNDSLNQGGSAIDRFAIIGNNLCVVNGSSVKVYDILNSAATVYKSSKSFSAPVLSLRSYKDSLLAPGFENSEFVLYSINKSGNLNQYADNWLIMKDYDPFTYRFNYLYVIQDLQTSISYTRSNIALFNINSHITGPFISSANLYNPKDISIDSNNNLFVCDSGLKVFDASVVNNISLTRHFNVEANHIVAYNDHLFVLGNSGLFQYQYDNGTLSLLSKINIVSNP